MLLTFSISISRQVSGSGNLLYPGEANILIGLRKVFPLGPHLYANIAAPPVLFSLYLESGGEGARFGENTFAPLYNALSRIKLCERVPPYQVFYNTPILTNTGTYLREIHDDFGILGIVLFPFILGFILTDCFFNMNENNFYKKIILLAHGYIIIFLSFDMLAMRWGEWAVSFFVSFLFLYIIKYSRSHLHRAVT